MLVYAPVNFGLGGAGRPKESAPPASRCRPELADRKQLVLRADGPRRGWESHAASPSAHIVTHRQSKKANKGSPLTDKKGVFVGFASFKLDKNVQIVRCIGCFDGIGSIRIGFVAASGDIDERREIILAVIGAYFVPLLGRKFP